MKKTMMITTKMKTKKVTLEDAMDFQQESKTYSDVLKHRRNCKLWTKGFCLDCFGGGLTQFTIDLDIEKSKSCGGSLDNKKQEKVKRSKRNGSGFRNNHSGTPLVDGTRCVNPRASHQIENQPTSPAIPFKTSSEIAKECNILMLKDIEKGGLFSGGIFNPPFLSQQWLSKEEHEKIVEEKLAKSMKVIATIKNIEWELRREVEDNLNLIESQGKELERRNILIEKLKKDFQARIEEFWKVMESQLSDKPELRFIFNEYINKILLRKE